MAKFKKGDRVRVKDNPTWMCGVPVDRPDLTPGTVVTVDRYEPDSDGDILVKISDENDSWAYDYISEDSVEPVVLDIHVGDLDIHVGDRVRVYNKRTEVTMEGVVRKIAEKDNHKWLWIGKGYDIAADLNTPEGYDISVLERAERWPDHEGFIRITGGPHAGQRGLALRAIFSDKMLIVTDDGGALYEDIVAGQDFDFEYVEG